ncbi:hypothetical protein DAI22_08g102300 [Oryza sativa Japonica Group]|nr:hypothetical protein DAI22_08g102300 [Oryza sativa Japonica Group]KAF2919002.1 hypothetical protein DAI22_08g102300 [Oryza sativa Japonica Group]
MKYLYIFHLEDKYHINQLYALHGAEKATYMYRRALLTINVGCGSKPDAAVGDIYLDTQDSRPYISSLGHTYIICIPVAKTYFSFLQITS